MLLLWLQQVPTGTRVNKEQYRQGQSTRRVKVQAGPSIEPGPSIKAGPSIEAGPSIKAGPSTGRVNYRFKMLGHHYLRFSYLAATLGFHTWPLP